MRWNRPRRQILVIFAFVVLALLGFIGLAVDLAQFLIYRAYVRRAVDAAAMAAASHFRSQYTSIDQMRQGMRRAAMEALALNGIDLSSFDVNIDLVTSVDPDPTDPTKPICDDPNQDATAVPDKYICFPRNRKKVWVRAEISYTPAFMRIFGFDRITLTSDAVGEAASLDVVLVIDISGSMAYAGNPPNDKANGQQDDPSYCNNYTDNGDLILDAAEREKVCLPFEYVRIAAIKFVRQILDLPCPDPADPTQCLEQDRLGLVFFSTGWESDPGAFRGTFWAIAPDGSPWFKRRSDAENMLWQAKVYTPEMDWRTWAAAGYPGWRGVARLYLDNKNGTPCPPGEGTPCYWGNVCMAPSSPYTCTTTNLGGALYMASQVLATDYREDALRVVVLLTTGVANTSGPVNAWGTPFPTPEAPPATIDPNRPYGYCPKYTWSYTPKWTICRDHNTLSRRTNPNDPNFDADDYAYYFADYLGCPPDPTQAADRGCAVAGLGAVMFAIGMGDEVLSTKAGTPPAGAVFLRYVANLGDDNDPRPDNDPCQGVPYNQDCGNYFYRASGADIEAVFLEIANRIFTRLSH